MQVHDSIRGHFAAALHARMKRDERVWLLTADLGYGMLDQIRDDYPGRFLNVGASEQAMIGIAVGLALEGKIPWCYSITPFLIYRPFEWLRNYLDHEGIPVKLAGAGLNKDYERDGITHHCEDLWKVLQCFPNIMARYPEKKDVEAAVNDACDYPGPYFLGLRR